MECNRRGVSLYHGQHSYTQHGWTSAPRHAGNWQANETKDGRHEQDGSHAAFEETSFLYGGNAQFIEHLYARYQQNPAAVDAHWRQFFAGLDQGESETRRRPLMGAQRLAAESPPMSGPAALDGNWA